MDATHFLIKDRQVQAKVSITFRTLSGIRLTFVRDEFYDINLHHFDEMNRKDYLAIYDERGRECIFSPNAVGSEERYNLNNYFRTKREINLVTLLDG